MSWTPRCWKSRSQRSTIAVTHRSVLPVTGSSGWIAGDAFKQKGNLQLKQRDDTNIHDISRTLLWAGPAVNCCRNTLIWRSFLKLKVNKSRASFCLPARVSAHRLHTTRHINTVILRLTLPRDTRSRPAAAGAFGCRAETRRALHSTAASSKTQQPLTPVSASCDGRLTCTRSATRYGTLQRRKRLARYRVRSCTVIVIVLVLWYNRLLCAQVRCGSGVCGNTILREREKESRAQTADMLILRRSVEDYCQIPSFTRYQRCYYWQIAVGGISYVYNIIFFVYYKYHKVLI